jgi:hypothetical protein
MKMKSKNGVLGELAKIILWVVIFLLLMVAAISGLRFLTGM